MDRINERFIWATEMLAVQPGENILEIGCGAGILAEQIAGKLNTGHITALDKSAAMIKMAEKRNRTLLASGKVKLINTDFAQAEFQDASFDKVVAFNLNLFWKKPQETLPAIRKIIKPNGKVFVFYQSPYEIDISAADPIKKFLQEFSFDIRDVTLKKMAPTSAFCVVAVPVIS